MARPRPLPVFNTVLWTLFFASSVAVRGQETPGRALAIAPYVGVGTVAGEGALESGGVMILLEVVVPGASVDGVVFTSVRGMGIHCAEASEAGGGSARKGSICGETPRALGVAVRTAFGRVTLGGGGAALWHRPGRWSFQPHLEASVGSGLVRGQVRIAGPVDGRLFVPVLLGVRIPLG